MNIIFASGNENKLKEYRELIEFYKLDWLKIYSLKDLGIEGFDPEETGSTYEENARIKAKALFDLINSEGTPISMELLVAMQQDYCVMADDSGLEVRGLDNAPGIYSHRFAEPGQHCSKIIEELGDKDPSAKYITNICTVFNDHSNYDAEGVCFGDIDTHPDKTLTGGSLFYPIFMPYDAPGKHLSDLRLSERCEMTHRAKAFMKVAKVMWVKQL